MQTNEFVVLNCTTSFKFGFSFLSDWTVESQSFLVLTQDFSTGFIQSSVCCILLKLVAAFSDADAFQRVLKFCFTSYMWCLKTAFGIWNFHCVKNTLFYVPEYLSMQYEVTVHFPRGGTCIFVFAFKDEKPSLFWEKLFLQTSFDVKMHIHQQNSHSSIIHTILIRCSHCLPFLTLILVAFCVISSKQLVTVFSCPCLSHLYIHKGSLQNWWKIRTN